MAVSGSISIATDGIMFFSFYGWVIFHAYVYNLLFVQSSIDGHLGDFHALATVTSPSVNIVVHVSF